MLWGLLSAEARASCNLIVIFRFSKHGRDRAAKPVLSADPSHRYGSIKSSVMIPSRIQFNLSPTFCVFFAREFAAKRRRASPQNIVDASELVSCLERDPTPSFAFPLQK